MPFRPVNERHAITEVAFAVSVSRTVDWDDRNRLRAAHSRWSALLPKIKDDPGLAVTMLRADSTQPPPQMPPPPLEFERYNPSGGVDWRLHIAQSNIIVNCLAYSLWNHVWPAVHLILGSVGDVITPPSRRITSLTLQYTNIFQHIEDSEDYDIETLLRRDCPHLPSTALDHGTLWHSHHGWFTHEHVPEGTRLLQRMHINGLEDSRGQNVVKMESLLRFDLLNDAVQPPLTEHTLNDFLDEKFALLHDRSKVVLSEYISPEMADRISLYAA